MIVEEKTGRHVEVAVVVTGDEGPRYRGGQAMTDGKLPKDTVPRGGGGQ